MTAIEKTFGLQLKLARIQLGLTQKEMAERLYVTQQTLSLLEADALEPKLSMIQAIIKLTGMPYEFFVGPW